MDGKEDRERLVELTVNSWNHLVQLWGVFGHGEESLEKRKNSVYKHSKELYADMIGEEEKRIEEKKTELVKLRSEMDLLTSQLELPLVELGSKTLLEEQSALNAKIDELKKVKAKKMELWLELREKEKQLCADLGEDLTEEPSKIPKEQEITAMKGLVHTLENELVRRNKKLVELTRNVSESLALLEKSPSSVIEKSLFNEVKPTLSLTFLKEAEQLESELSVQVQQNKERVASYWQIIKQLWKRLEIDQVEQDLFEKLHLGIKPSVIDKLRTEHGRLEVLKIANLAKFISKLRTDILALSNEVFKRTILPEELPTEDCLQEHETILLQLQKYAADNHKVIELFNRRCEMWQQWKEFEAKAEDPNRLNNRGGGLLKEEKLRRILEKKLPKIEKEIADLSNSSNGFKIFDVEVIDLMQREIDEHNRDKEDRKAEKKKAATADKTMMNQTRKRTGTPCGATTPGKRNKLMPYNNKVVSCTPGRGGLRGRMVSPACTYTDFTNHQQIFQSTLNNGQIPSSQPESAASTPKKIQPTPTKMGTVPRANNKKLFMTPTMHI